MTNWIAPLVAVAFGLPWAVACAKFTVRYGPRNADLGTAVSVTLSVAGYVAVLFLARHYLPLLGVPS